MFDIKKNEYELILQYKARVTVRGFEEKAGIGLTDIFVSALRLSSLCLVLLMSAVLSLIMRLVDVVQAFPCAPLREEIYVEPSEGSGLYLFRGLGMDYDNSMELCKSCVTIAEKKAKEI